MPEAERWRYMGKYVGQRRGGNCPSHRRSIFLFRVDNKKRC